MRDAQNDQAVRTFTLDSGGQESLAAIQGYSSRSSDVL